MGYLEGAFDGKFVGYLVGTVDGAIVGLAGLIVVEIRLILGERVGRMEGKFDGAELGN